MSCCMLSPVTKCVLTRLVSLPDGTFSLRLIAPCAWQRRITSDVHLRMVVLAGGSLLAWLICAGFALAGAPQTALAVVSTPLSQKDLDLFEACLPSHGIGDPWCVPSFVRSFVLLEERLCRSRRGVVYSGGRSLKGRKSQVLPDFTSSLLLQPWGPRDVPGLVLRGHVIMRNRRQRCGGSSFPNLPVCEYLAWGVCSGTHWLLGPGTMHLA